MRYPEHVEAARLEAEKLGASLELETRKKHLIGVIYYNGKCRKTSFSVSPSRLACHQTIKYVRRAVAELKK